MKIRKRCRRCKEWFSGSNPAVTRRRRFCSQNCYWRYGKVQVTCGQCQKSFNVIRSRFIRTHDLACSRECANRIRTRRKVSESFRKRATIWLTRPESVEKKLQLTPRGKSHHAFKGGKNMRKVCVKCRRVFWVYPSVIRQVCCSQRCALLKRRMNQGSRHWAWKGGLSRDPCYNKRKYILRQLRNNKSVQIPEWLDPETLLYKN